MQETRPSPWPRRARRVAIGAPLLLLLAAALFVSVRPTVELHTRPTAQDIAAARQVWSQLKQTKGAETGSVRVDNRAMRGLAKLASDATDLARFEGEVTRGVLSGRASVSLPAGLWINLSASATGTHVGFPEYRLSVGRVTFPAFAGRWAAELGRALLRLRGADIPPLDEMVRRASVDREDVLVEIALPARSGVVDELIVAGGAGLDQPLVSDIYCRIAAEQRRAPVGSLPELVRRAFDPAHAKETEAYNRAAFVALSFLVVGEKAEALAASAAAMKGDCPHPPATFVLHRRADLAKHWAFSAALTAVLGEETAANLGEWKELDDSLANGSGFSFVDIAADRSGMRAALRALDPATAKSTVAALRRATDDALVPASLLRTPEGLSEASFVDRFGGLDRQRYRQAIATIDRELAR